MKIVVIGGTGLIGTKLVAGLSEQGHEAIAASPNTGVDTLTGEGLAEVLVGAEVVVDVSNSPSFEDEAVLAFFHTSTTNLLAAAKAAGVGHLVALSVVGTGELAESGYFRAKIAQEALITAGDVPFTIVHATQFFEFVGSMAAAGTQADGAVHLATVRVQPMAADDVAVAVARAALAAPTGGIVEVGGPEEFRLDAFIRQGLEAQGDARTVVGDPSATYFGAALHEWTLVPGQSNRDKPQLGETRFASWLEHNTLRL